jgi:hypothetical protein
MDFLQPASYLLNYYNVKNFKMKLHKDRDVSIDLTILWKLNPDKEGGGGESRLPLTKTLKQTPWP